MKNLFALFLTLFAVLTGSAQSRVSRSSTSFTSRSVSRPTFTRPSTSTSSPRPTASVTRTVTAPKPVYRVTTPTVSAPVVTRSFTTPSRPAAVTVSTQKPATTVTTTAPARVTLLTPRSTIKPSEFKGTSVVPTQVPANTAVVTNAAAKQITTTAPTRFSVTKPYTTTTASTPTTSTPVKSVSPAAVATGVAAATVAAAAVTSAATPSEPEKPSRAAQAAQDYKKYKAAQTTPTASSQPTSAQHVDSHQETSHVQYSQPVQNSTHYFHERTSHGSNWQQYAAGAILYDALTDRQYRRQYYRDAQGDTASVLLDNNQLAAEQAQLTNGAQFAQQSALAPVAQPVSNQPQPEAPLTSPKEDSGAGAGTYLLAFIVILAIVLTFKLLSDKQKQNIK